MEKNEPIKSDPEITNGTDLVGKDINIVIFNFTYCSHMFKKLEEGFGILGRNMADIKRFHSNF